MPIINGLDRHQLTFSSLEATIATKKAVIVKLLLVFLKATLRKLHNTLLAPYGGPALSLSKGSTGFTSHFNYLFWCSVIFNSSLVFQTRRLEGFARTERS